MRPITAAVLESNPLNELDLNQVVRENLNRSGRRGVGEAENVGKALAGTKLASFRASALILMVRRRTAGQLESDG